LLEMERSRPGKKSKPFELVDKVEDQTAIINPINKRPYECFDLCWN
jgi:hypothetical protein